MGSVEYLSKQVLEDLGELCPALYKSPREKLSVLVAVALEAGSCNTMEWAVAVGWGELAKPNILGYSRTTHAGFPSSTPLCIYTCCQVESPV